MAYYSLISLLTKSIFVRQVGSTVIAQGSVLFLSLVTTSIAARWLGPAGKGQLAMIIMIPAMLQLLLGFGLGSANVYFVASGRLHIHQLTANAIAFSILGTVMGLILFPIILMDEIRNRLLPGVSQDYLMMGMVSLPIGLLIINLNGILQGLQRIHTLNVLKLVGSFMTLFFMTVLVIGMELGILGAIAATLAGQAILLIVTGRCVQREGSHLWPKLDPKVFGPTLRYGLKGYVGSIFQFFNYRFDIFLVNIFLGPTGVGIYGVSVALAELLWQIPNATSYVIFSKSANTTQEIMNRFTPKVFWSILVVTVTLAIGMALFGKLVIRILFSNDFLEAYIPLLILLPGVTFLGAAKVLTHDIAGRGYPHYNSITAGVSLAVTVILDLIFIPYYGVAGAAFASTVSYIISFFLSIRFFLSISRLEFMHACTNYLFH